MSWKRCGTPAATEITSPGLTFRTSSPAVKREWLEALLQQTADLYGSVAGYLSEQLGIGAAELTSLQDRFLVRPGA